MASQRPGDYQKAYNKESNKTRDVKLNGQFGSATGGVYINWDGDEFTEAVMVEIEKVLEPIMKEMAEAAKAKVHIGKSKRDPRPSYKRGQHAFQPYTSREPGRLRDSIKGRTARRKDKTAVLGFLEAGNTLTDYAFVEELGVPGRSGGQREGHSFLRSTFNERIEDARQRILQAIENL
jgi:hypothetical protein